MSEINIFLFIIQQQENHNPAILAAMLGVLIKIYDDIVDFNLSLSKNEMYMCFLKTWIVLTTLFILDECFIIGPLALIIMFCSYLCDRMDDVFWFEYAAVIACFCLPQMYRFIETSGLNLLLLILSILGVLYEEIGFPEEISDYKITSRLNGTLVIALSALLLEASEMSAIIDTSLLSLFMVFGESYCLTSVINQILFSSSYGTRNTITATTSTTKTRNSNT
jgi:hypothetical protein